MITHRTQVFRGDGLEIRITGSQRDDGPVYWSAWGHSRSDPEWLINPIVAGLSSGDEAVAVACEHFGIEPEEFPELVERIERIVLRAWSSP
jgi:hypothetical protein